MSTATHQGQSSSDGNERPCLCKPLTCGQCDLAEPACRRCIESSRRCPGPLKGIIVVASETTPVGKLKPRQLRPHVDLNTRSRAWRLDSSNIDNPTPLVATPALIPIYEQTVLVKFLEFFCRNARPSSWTLRLPELKDDPEAYALRSALRAVSLAYAAHVTDSKTVRYEAYRQYGRSLQRQRRSMTVVPAGIDLAAAGRLLLAMVVLSYFELLSGTTSMAWLEHMAAAENLMVMSGRDSLRQEVIREMFYTVRSHSLLRAIIYGQYSSFSNREWSEESLAGILSEQRRSTGRRCFDSLVQYILYLSRFLYGYESFSGVTDASHLFRSLSKLYDDFLQMLGLDYTAAPLLGRSRETESTLSDDLTDTKVNCLMRSDFIATAASYFHAAAIILSILPNMGTSPYEIRHNARSIIALGNHLGRPSGANGVSILRMVLPFSCIWCFSCDSALKRQAKDSFTSWSTREGFAGLSAIAFPMKRPRVNVKFTHSASGDRFEYHEMGGLHENSQV